MKTTSLILGVMAFALVATGCSRRVVTVNYSPAMRRGAAPRNAPIGPVKIVRPAEPDAPDMLRITHDSEPEPIAEPAEMVVAPIAFAPRETEHVRIVEYDPFVESDELSIDLDRLARYFHYPHPGHLLSNYGMRGRAMHTGIDLKASAGDTIRAALGGVVRMSKPYSGYGNIVVIRHPNGLETAYAHNTRNLVAPNDVVAAGDPIALAGRTGRATGDHLHFEVRIAGEHFDPNLLLDTDRRALQHGILVLQRRNGRILASNAAADAPADEPIVLASNPLPGVPTAPATTAASSAPSAESHTVQRGDTLYSLSRRYGLTVEALCALNGITPQSTLAIGQRLKLK